MPAREPRILVDHAAQQRAELVVGALPQRTEGARGGDDRIVVDAVLGADLGDLVGHARAAGDAVDQALGFLEHGFQDRLGGAHLPQDVHVDARFGPGDVARHARLVQGALDGVGDQFVVPLAAGLALVDLAHDVAVRVRVVGVDARERAHPAGLRPSARAFAVGHGNAFAAFDQRQDLAARNHHRFERKQRLALGKLAVTERLYSP